LPHSKEICVFFHHSLMTCILLIMFQMWYLHFHIFKQSLQHLNFPNLVGKMCWLVSTRIEPIHITSTILSYTYSTCFCIICAPMDFMPFVECFIGETFKKNLNTIISFIMLVDPHVTFALFSFCYAQHLSYLLCIVFMFLGILWYYVKFNLHTIVMLEKLLGSRSFGIMMGHLVVVKSICLFL
jgi:hypothetical protein